MDEEEEAAFSEASGRLIESVISFGSFVADRSADMRNADGNVEGPVMCNDLRLILLAVARAFNVRIEQGLEAAIVWLLLRRVDGIALMLSGGGLVGVTKGRGLGSTILSSRTIMHRASHKPSRACNEVCTALAQGVLAEVNIWPLRNKKTAWMAGA